MALSKAVMEKILTDEMFSPDILLHKKSDATELLLFRDLEEWYAVAFLLVENNQVCKKSTFALF